MLKSICDAGSNPEFYFYLSQNANRQPTLLTRLIYQHHQSLRSDGSRWCKVSTCTGDKIGVESRVNLPLDTQQWIYGCVNLDDFWRGLLHPLLHSAKQRVASNSLRRLYQLWQTSNQTIGTTRNCRAPSFKTPQFVAELRRPCS